MARFKTHFNNLFIVLSSSGVMVVVVLVAYIYKALPPQAP